MKQQYRIITKEEIEESSKPMNKKQLKEWLERVGTPFPEKKTKKKEPKPLTKKQIKGFKKIIINEPDILYDFVLAVEDDLKEKIFLINEEIINKINSLVDGLNLKVKITNENNKESDKKFNEVIDALHELESRIKKLERKK